MEGTTLPAKCVFCGDPVGVDSTVVRQIVYVGESQDGQVIHRKPGGKQIVYCGTCGLPPRRKSC